MKKLLTIVLVVGTSCLLLALFATIIFESNRYFDGAETNGLRDVAESFTEAVYKADNCNDIYGLLPEEFQDKLLETTKKTWDLETDEDALSFLYKPIGEYRDTLNKIFGEGWTFEYEVGEIDTYTAEEIADLNLQLKMMDVEGYEAKDAARVNMEVKFQAVNGTAGSAEFYVPVFFSGNSWALGQYIGLGAPDTDLVFQTRFGDLMDGFPIVGNFDTDGNRVEYSDDGYMITEQDDGTWIGSDEYGNVRYYDEGKKFLYASGPDGGDEITESQTDEGFDPETEGSINNAGE